MVYSLIPAWVQCLRDAANFRFLSTGVLRHGSRRKQNSVTVICVKISAVAFSSQEDKLLIESVRKYPVLYDSFCSQYKHMPIKNLIWKEISLENPVVNIY